MSQTSWLHTEESVATDYCSGFQSRSVEVCGIYSCSLCFYYYLLYDDCKMVEITITHYQIVIVAIVII